MKQHVLARLKNDWKKPEKKTFNIYEKGNAPTSIEVELDSEMTI